MNGPPIITVDNLGKRYRIGVATKRSRNLKEALRKAAFAPFKYLHGRLHGATEEETLWALKNVSFEVQQGEVLGIIGRNGAGKSTLLKILSRITDPTEGRAVIRGRVNSLLEVGTGFHPELTGRENIYMNAALHGMKRREINSKLDEIITFAEVEKFLDTPVKRYSSGMYTRLAFAVAAHLEPEILIVDEVLAVGDMAFQQKCLGRMQTVAGQGRSVLFVSHNMGAVGSLCTRCMVLEEGRVVTIGKTADAVNFYLQGCKVVFTGGSLVDHPNRDPKFDQHLTGFDINLPNGVALMGEPLSLHIHYDFKQPIRTPQFCVLFDNDKGVRVFTLISDYQKSDIPDMLSGQGVVSCRIPHLPLLPGEYYVSLKLWQPHGQLDGIENVSHFRVEWIDRGAKQTQWDNTMGVVYVDAAWRLEYPKRGMLHDVER